MEHKGHERPHILFVCGRNKWRSPTAERLYRNDERIEVRSGGASAKSRHPTSYADIQWADLILVRDGFYKSWMRAKFRDFPLPRIENLDIPDEYEYRYEELIDSIRSGVEYHIEQIAGFLHYGNLSLPTQAYAASPAASGSASRQATGVRQFGFRFGETVTNYYSFSSVGEFV